MRLSRGIWFGVVAVSSLSAAQQGPTATPLPGQRGYTMVQTETDVQKLPDGATVTHTTILRTTRDSRGRMRTDRQMQGGSTVISSQGSTQVWQATNGATSTFITDPVQHLNLSWDEGPSRQKIVRQSHNYQAPRVQSAPRPTLSPDLPTAESRFEDLGTKTIHGLEARGSRSTITFPANFDGNSSAYTRTIENWTVSKLAGGGRTVESISDFPWMKSTTVLTSFTEGEPDPKLFEPPNGYTVWDQNNPASEQGFQ